MNPKVSVIVPIFNAEKYMKKCIDSILSQTLKNIEIILVNDGSSDNSANIAKEYSRLDKRVRVIHQNNSGPSVARNMGISIARGKYVGFVDSDDYIEKTMYEELFKSADKNNVPYVIVLGENEVNEGTIEIKDMKNKTTSKFNINDIEGMKEYINK